MEPVYLSNCLNKPVRLFGSSFFGVIGGGAALVLVWILFNMLVGLLSSVVGYTIGRFFGMIWHQGKLQRQIYWQLPVSDIVGGKTLPPSHERRYF